MVDQHTLRTCTEKYVFFKQEKLPFHGFPVSAVHRQNHAVTFFPENECPEEVKIH